MLAAAYSMAPPTGTWYLDVLQSAVMKATEFGYQVVLHPCDLKLAEESQKVVRLVDQSSVDGLMLLPPYGGKSEFTDMLARRAIPFVQIEPPSLDGMSISVSVTNKQGAFDMTEYLISIGHRMIGFIKGAPYHRVTEERFAGYREALERDAIPFHPEYVMQGNFSFESGIVNGRLLLKMELRPTAIFASNDEMAAGVLQAAYQSGLTVPDDVSVAGYEDYSWARRLSPPLTSVRGQISEMAGMATELLIRLVEGADVEEPVHHEVATTLVVRESTGPPRS
jgi:LacI family transcriptional regulator